MYVRREGIYGGILASPRAAGWETFAFPIRTMRNLATQIKIQFGVHNIPHKIQPPSPKNLLQLEGEGGGPKKKGKGSRGDPPPSEPTHFTGKRTFVGQ